MTGMIPFSTLTLKFFVPGHSFMSADAFHAAVERNIKKEFEVRFSIYSKSNCNEFHSNDNWLNSYHISNKILDYLEVKKVMFDSNQLNYNHFNFNQIVIKSVQMIIDWTHVTFQMKFKIISKSKKSFIWLKPIGL